MRCVLLVLLVAACDPVWSVDVHVVTPDDTPLAGATVALTECAGSVDDWTIQTDAAGDAAFGGVGFDLPDCAITAGHPGFESFQTTIATICGGPVEDCDRAQTLTVVLDPEPPSP